MGATGQQVEFKNTRYLIARPPMRPNNWADEIYVYDLCDEVGRIKHTGVPGDQINFLLAYVPPVGVEAPVTLGP